MARQRKMGLWLDNVRIEVEDVKPAHRLPCEWCEELPERRRLKIVRGSARSAVSGVLCIACGVQHIASLREEAGRAIDFLRLGACHDHEGIRLPEAD